ncbi:MAG: hypothetical protein GF418_15700 [Chitinivibrionales bacterium]|nr:hypothetical protein [Chitinivibrionales bacterium]MBD3397066.1 hypothetical protein [Chitinivibrionales bacterium]
MRNAYLQIFLAATAISLVLLSCLCVKHTSPYEQASNADVDLIIPSPPDTGYLSGDSVDIGIDLLLAHLVDSVYVDESGGWDTTLRRPVAVLAVCWIWPRRAKRWCFPSEAKKIARLVPLTIKNQPLPNMQGFRDRISLKGLPMSQVIVGARGDIR